MGTAPTAPACLIGQVMLTAGTISYPGTMPAAGQILTFNQYSGLGSVMGDQFGGNGSTTFALPDLRSAAPNGLTYSICVTGTFP